jgi:hypothetical protein
LSRYRRARVSITHIVEASGKGPGRSKYCQKQRWCDVPLSASRRRFAPSAVISGGFAIARMQTFCAAAAVAAATQPSAPLAMRQEETSNPGMRLLLLTLLTALTT